ncbi:MAG: monovalent cation/H+ antiporter subunit A [Polyangiaceae bacterium]|nr:monovalent cation/H+ antiporter subunit A [Polyangiaceae bacterium]
MNFTWLPWLALFGALLPGPLRRLRIDPALVAGAVATLGLGLLIRTTPEVVVLGQTLKSSVPWVPSLGLAISLRLDGLGFLMCGLILGIGLLVVLYARYYLKPEEATGRFYGPLLAFMGAMLGIALSENLLLLVVFWELTSISSFLLISFWQFSTDARRGARMALTVTGLGGLALLAGVIWIGQIVGSYELTQVIEHADVLKAHPHYPAVLCLVLLGAFTKSAQFPFHFWLPHAMAAPTPVSAYLHSATMVKAGVFLLARCYPFLAGTELWFYLVTITGMLTLLIGSFLALFQNDLKGLLAYSTVSHLGLITLLFGLDTDLAPKAALLHLLNHAVFKASLFMAAGIIDHETGTRDLRRLSGLFKPMPVTATLAIVAAASMAGIPLLNGFLSKEMFFTETLDADDIFGRSWILPVGATLASVLSVAYSVRFVRQAFFGPPATGLEKTPHEPPRWLRVPVELLVLLCIAIGVAPALLVGDLIHAAASACVQGELPPYTIALWHGFNTPLVMSIVALIGGILVYARRERLFRGVEARLSVSQGRRAFEGIVAALVGSSQRLERALRLDQVTTHLRGLLACAVLVSAWLLLPALARVSPTNTSGDLVLWVLCGVALFALAGVLLKSERPLTAIVYSSIVGLAVTLTFAYLSAPDLALTQLLVELVAILLLLAAVPHFGLPPRDKRSSPVRALDGALALGVGGAVTIGCWLMLSTDVASISRYFLEKSVPLGQGNNVVNVILVDFRGFDTFGEVTVLAIASLGILALFDHLAQRQAPSDLRPRTPLFLQSVTKLLLNLALLTAVFLFLRGHNAPGGGFIAGLTAAVGLVFVYQARNPTGAPARRPASMSRWLAAGVLLAALPGVAAMLFGRAFLTAGHVHLPLPLVGEVHLSTVLVFDLGVFVVVVATVLAILPTLGRLPLGKPTAEEER